MSLFKISFSRTFFIIWATIAAFFILAMIGATDQSVFAQKTKSKSNFVHKMPQETNLIPETVSSEDLQKNFLDPTSIIRTGAYWYWLSGNISQDGVVKDLQAMKKAGINRAFIGDIGPSGLKRGAVRTLTDDWWAAIHTALKTATELDIEMGIFNSPGWSQSGGPWIKYDRAMRYLTCSELRVTGPEKISKQLVQPEEEFQDVKVLAYPVPSGSSVSFEGNGKEKVLPQNQEYEIEFALNIPMTYRSIIVEPEESPIVAHAELLAEIDGKMQKIDSFEISRYNPEINVGFIPYAPIVSSFPAVTTNRLRLVLKSERANSALKSVTFSGEPRIENVYEKTLAKMHQTPQPPWSEYQWERQAPIDDLKAIVDPSSILDISDKMAADGTLNWNVPEGEWVILRMGMTPTKTTNAPAVPEATGYEVDKMSREHVAYHFDSYLGELLKRVPAEDRKSFKIVVQDSYEVGGQNFTDDFLRKFEDTFGYDPLPYLPTYFGYVVGNPDDSDRFLWDLRRFIANEVAYEYVGGLRDISNENGFKTWLECYGHWGFPGEWLQYGGQSDEIAGEYWSTGTLGDIENRIASSCGHIYGKKQIWAESNTCAAAPFNFSPVHMKERTDRFFSEGINNSLLHLYILQPDERKPGMNAWFGNEFNRHNTWFSQMDLFTLYLKRVNYMLQQGLNVADVAYFIGEDAPKMMGLTEPELPPGYQYDFMNAEVLVETMTVENGLLTLPHGTQYRVLVLPPLETMRPEVLEKIAQLVRQGAVVLGPKPNRSPSLQNQPEADQKVKKWADELWGNVDGDKVKYRNVDKGIIASGMTLNELLALIGSVPDCQFAKDAPIRYGHRILDNADIYFVANQSEKTLNNIPFEFRTSGKTPELWNPVSGIIRPLADWKCEKNQTSISLNFAPLESYFIVFRTATDLTENKGENFPKGKEIARLEGNWTVQFDSGEIARGPKEPLLWDQLINWAESKEDDVKYFSGTAQYSTTFSLTDVDSNDSLILSLGDVAEMAKVKINGQYVGGVWTFPYELDVTNFVQKGENKIEIEVVNLWVNRLIGDQNLPEDQRKTWCPINSWQANSPLKKSGLIGPVVIKSVSKR
ncbi:MAG: glycosyl hydrolase [Planctomycetia bacterium]|nr:glycosyl hydrolase [Planctomycetia bacterium]